MKALSVSLLAWFLAGCLQKPWDRPPLAREGEPAPQLILDKVLNAPIKELKNIDELKGKAVVLEFWATWSAPSVESIPHFNALAEKFSGKPVVFISVTDESEANVEAFLKSNPIKGWVAPEAYAWTLRSFKVEARPHTVLLDKELNVVALMSPSEITAEKISALIAGVLTSFPASPVDGK